MSIATRPARREDRAALIQVEAGATPNLSYLDHVFDMFLGDDRGEFTVAEVAGNLVACGKFTTLPDETAWLETIRVLPEYQGRGIGKRFYERFFEVAQAEGVKTMRMYTGVKNAVSKGLAEHFGFELAETFYSATLDRGSIDSSIPLDASRSRFEAVTEPGVVAQLLLEHAADWNDYLVMNRTFYRLTPALCSALAQSGQVYARSDGGAVLVAGARFMPDVALHIGHFSGNATACFDFATHLAAKGQTKSVSCLFPQSQNKIQECLTDYGFQLGASQFIVMERHLSC